jgi:hypothetical protein
MKNSNNQQISYSLPIVENRSKINSRIFSVYDGPSYKILSYDKNIICFDEPETTTKYRSVVYSFPEHKLLSFSPPMSLPFHKFVEKYAFDQSNLLITEHIEGLLIHLFYDKRIQSWEIATKNAIGGKIRPYQNGQKPIIMDNPTIYHMFLDSLRAPEKSSLNKVVLLDGFDKNCSYTFVLQHHKNPIVLKVEQPELYLVAVYNICNTENNDPSNMTAKSISQLNFEQWDMFKNTPILFPKIYNVQDFGSYSQLQECFGSSICNVNVQSSMLSIGINIVNNETGERTRIDNPLYTEQLRIFKTNSSFLFQYLCLKRIKRDTDFIHYFPKSKKMFENFNSIVQDFIKNLHDAYMTRYVRKHNVNILPKYSKLIDRIHKEKRIPSLQKNTQNKSVKITHNIVKKYVNKLEPIEILQWLNYTPSQNSHKELL